MVAVSKVTKEILFKLLASLFSFYAVYYVVASVAQGILRLQDFDGTIPFHYQSYEDIFTNSTRWNDPVFLGDFVSLECTYLIVPFFFVIFLRNYLWDYAISVTVIHCLLVCIVNLAFPLTWEWWVCILMGLSLMIGLGELTNGLIRMKTTGSFCPLGKDDNKVT